MTYQTPNTVDKGRVMGPSEGGSNGDGWLETLGTRTIAEMVAYDQGMWPETYISQLHKRVAPAAWDGLARRRTLLYACILARLRNHLCM